MIELVTVAIIILVLISIALPNFLEARIRAQVTASYADMEIVSQVLEEYYIGFRAYPPNQVPLLTDGSLAGDGEPFLRGSALTILTTPAVYLSHLPFDQFHPDGIPVEFYDYVNLSDLNGGPYSLESFNLPGTAAYLLAGRGPNKLPDTWMGKIPFYGVSYAPTNGTKSVGDLYRFGP
jgi:type II secretory pathway pseudopilin PulG